MRIFIDTNVLISAALFPNGVAANAFERAVSTPNDPIVSDYVIDELRRVFARKFPKKLPALDTFLAAISSCIEIVVTPNLEMVLTPGDNRHQASGDSVHFQPDDIGQCAGIRKC